MGLTFSAYPMTYEGKGATFLFLRRLTDASAKHNNLIITSAKEIMFSSVLVSLFVSFICLFAGLICLFVCVCVSRITQKLLNRFSQNSVERWHMGHGTNRYILVVIRLMLLSGLGLGSGYGHR